MKILTVIIVSAITALITKFVIRGGEPSPLVAEPDQVDWSLLLMIGGLGLVILFAAYVICRNGPLPKLKASPGKESGAGKQGK